MEKYSTPTAYHGIKFRSRLEADFARFFDGLGIVWSYEEQGYKLENGLSYLPDFWLPQQKAFFECKGIMLDEDKEKILTLAKESGHDVFVGSHIYNGKVLLSVADAFNGSYALSEGDVYIARCYKCNRVWLMAAWGDWKCRCCGAYDGNGHFEIIESFPMWGGIAKNTA